jgi:hypothetical protein
MDLEEIFAETSGTEIAGAIFGSRARNAEGVHSDYDILVLSRFADDGRFYFVPEDRLSAATHRVCVFYRTLDQALTSVTLIDEDWPVRNAMFRHHRVVFDRLNLFPLIQNELESVTEDARRRGFEEVARHAFEYLSKVRNLRGLDRTKECGRRFLDKVARALAIHHRHIFVDYCDFVSEIATVADVSPDVREGMRGLAGYLNWDARRVASEADALWGWFQQRHSVD